VNFDVCHRQPDPAIPKRIEQFRQCLGKSTRSLLTLRLRTLAFTANTIWQGHTLKYIRACTKSAKAYRWTCFHPTRRLVVTK
jgi:hypothetical protein